MRRDVDNGRVHTGFEEEAADHQRARTPKVDVRGTRAWGICVADNYEIGDGARLDRLQNLWDPVAAFLSQIVRFESEVQREVLCRRGEGIERLVKNPLDLRLAQNRYRRR